MRVRRILAILVIGISVQACIAAEVQYPLSLAVTDSGVTYLADRDLPGIWKLEGGNLAVFFQGSKKFRTPLNAIRCVAVDREGKLWCGDSATRDVYRLDGENQAVGLTQKTTAPPESPAADASKEETKPAADNPAADNPAADNPAADNPAADKPAADKPAADKPAADKPAADKPAADKPAESSASKPERPKFIHGEIGIPMDIAFDKNGDLFVSDLELHRIVHVAKNGGAVKDFASVNAPRGLCFDDQENLWVISGRRLVKLNAKGEATTVVDNGTFQFPHTVAVASDQTAYVCDGYAKTVWKVPAGGKPEKFVSGEPFVNPVGMRLVKDKLVVVDPRARALFQISLDKQVTPVPLKTNQP